MVVFVAHTAVNACNTGNERKSDVVNCGATCIMIEHFAKGEEVDMVEKILTIIAGEWRLLYACYKLVRWDISDFGPDLIRLAILGNYCIGDFLVIL